MYIVVDTLPNHFMKLTRTLASILTIQASIITIILERKIQYQTQPIKPFNRILDIIIVMKGCVMNSRYLLEY